MNHIISIIILKIILVDCSVINTNIDNKQLSVTSTELIRKFIITKNPQYLQYQIIKIRQLNITNPNRSFILSMANNDVSLFLRVYMYKDQFFSVFASTLIPRYLSTQIKANIQKNNSSNNQTFIYINNNSSRNNIQKKYETPPILGGYRYFNNFSQVRLLKIVGTLLQLYPNLINYLIQQVYYQIVVGINFKIIYKGLDGFTRVQIISNIDLKMKVTVQQFKVTCLNNNTNNCTQQLALMVYEGIQQQIQQKQQILLYHLTNIQIVYYDSQNDILQYNVLFQSNLKKYRAIMDINVEDGQANLQAYFIYPYDLF